MRSFYKQHLYKQRQAKIGKKIKQMCLTILGHDESQTHHKHDLRLLKT